MSSIVKLSTDPDEDRLYPSEDREPVGETDWHMMALIWLREALEDHFAGREDVKVASDMFLYYVEGDPSACKAPDVMVIPGVNKRLRRTFKTWVEKALPSAIIEIASERTWQEDIGDKCTLYAQLGVPDYFVFDPEGSYLRPPLQGFRRKGQKYVRLAVGAEGSLTSKELGLRLIAEGPMLRLIDPQTGQPIPTRKERIDALAAEVARLQAAKSKRKGKKR